MGFATGGPYPVASRISWGVFGANFPALVRGIVAIAWYGIQTYLASIAIKAVLLRFVPASEGLTHTSFVGLDLLGWISFLILWAIQLVIVARGLEAVRHFQGFAGPLIWVVMIALAVYLVIRAGGRISLTTGVTSLSTGEQVYQTFAAAGLMIGVLATLMLNFSDFARFAPSKRSVVIGNFWGLPVNFTAFIFTSVVVSAASAAVYGKPILDPAEILGKLDNSLLLLVGAAVFVLATVGVNIVANFVSPAFDLANVWPRYINFRRGGIIAAVLSLLTVPWKLFGSPQIVTYFLGTLGALLGPFFGVMIVDFFVLRRQKVKIEDLYLPTPESDYYFRRGVNPRAIVAFVPASIVSLILADVPYFHRITPFSWFIGAALAGLIYYSIARGHVRPARRAPQVHVTEVLTNEDLAEAAHPIHPRHPSESAPPEDVAGLGRAQPARED
jgi:NCS1 family nucleobase:cation symporter-1